MAVTHSHKRYAARKLHVAHWAIGNGDNIMSWNMAGRPSKWLAEDRPFTLPEVSSLGEK